MKFTLETSIKALVGKTFKSSEFRGEGESHFDVFDNEVKLEDFNPVGQVILNAFLFVRCGDTGLALNFKDCPNPLFFYANEEIEVD